MQNLYLICNLDVISFPNVISFVHCIIYVGTQKLSRHSRLHMFPSRQQKRSKGEAKTKCQLSYYHQRTKILKTQLSANWIFIRFHAIIACTAFLRVKIFDWKCFDFYDFKKKSIKISLFSSLCCFSDFVHFVALWLPHHLLLDSLWQQKKYNKLFPIWRLQIRAQHKYYWMSNTWLASHRTDLRQICHSANTFWPI